MKCPVCKYEYDGNISTSVIARVWQELSIDEKQHHRFITKADMDAVNECVSKFGTIYDCVILDADTFGYRSNEYNFLNAVSKRIYALIDKNTIVEGRFNIDDFIHSLGISEFVELTQNFRNNYSISCFLSKYNCSDSFSFGTRIGEPIKLFRYSKNQKEKFRTITQIVKMNRGRKIGVVVSFDDVDALVESLKLTFVNTKVVNCWSYRFQEKILSDEKYIGVASNTDLCFMEFDVVIVMLNDALESMPDNDSANKRCLYRIFSVAKDRLYVGISNEIPLKYQGKRILDERNEFAKFVDYKLYETC